MLVAALQLLTVVALGARTEAAPARCYCVPAGQCGGLITGWETKAPHQCAAGGGQCCDLDRLPEAALLGPPSERRPPPTTAAEPELGLIEFDGFELPSVPLHEPDPFPRPEPDPQFDIQLPDSFDF
ncbi:hypothetical protein FJT64_026418 [Amphibalanus amphitrite]|uniref:Uncharacterized protein n=1 Tax=Amphibalanus amphitrite TaxID=1232801 RepID=A0A6A4WC38_AMPAM|nr:hypothetical protein FJT64_026418 [Amphibalanus amphitrite]